MGESLDKHNFQKKLCFCSRHFSPAAFESFCRPQLVKKLTGAGGYKQRLKPNAVPTMFNKICQRQETLYALLLGCKQPAPLSQPLNVNHPMALKPSDTILDTVSPSFSPAIWKCEWSSTTTDATTQTDVSTDIHYPITMDHISADKQLEKMCHCDTINRNKFVCVIYYVY